MQDKMKPVLGSLPLNGHQSRTGLVLDLALNENGGDKINDYSLNGNNGTNNGATWVAGESGPALSFDGLSDNVKIARIGGFDKLTVISKVKINTATTDASIIEHTAAWIANNAFVMRVVGGASPAFYFGGATTGFVFNVWQSAVVNLNQYYTVAMTIDKTKSSASTKGYVDGVLSGTQGSNGDISGAPFDVDFACIGSRDIFSRFFPGEIEYISIYDRIFTPQEIKAQYDNPWQAWEKDNIALWAAATQGGVVPPTGFEPWWAVNNNNLIGAC